MIETEERDRERGKELEGGQARPRGGIGSPVQADINLPHSFLKRTPSLGLQRREESNNSQW